MVWWHIQPRSIYAPRNVFIGFYVSSFESGFLTKLNCEFSTILRMILTVALLGVPGRFFRVTIHGVCIINRLGDGASVASLLTSCDSAYMSHLMLVPATFSLVMSLDGIKLCVVHWSVFMTGNGNTANHVRGCPCGVNGIISMS